MALIVLALVEAVAWCLIGVKGPKLETLFPFIPPRDLLHADAYKDASWTRGYCSDWSNADIEWHSFGLYRHKPYTSETVNFDASGLRRTVQDPPKAGGRARKVAVFGGSTMVGYAARDAGTIPSSLARVVQSELRESGPEVEVTNFGEVGWNNSQELVALEIELRRGNVPDLVIFYDGVNEVIQTVAQKKAGAAPLDGAFAAFFDPMFRRRNGKIAAMGVLGFAMDSSTVNLVVDRTETLAAADQPKLADEVVREYAQDIAHLEVLARAFGFKLLCYWQPVLFTCKKPLSPWEAKRRDEDVVWTFRHGGKALYENVYSRVGAALADRQVFHDLSDTFDKESASFFVDYCHVSEAANELVARRMAKDVVPALAPLK
jgi:hypothetical protein